MSYGFSRTLLSISEFSQLLESIVKNVSELFETEAVLLLSENNTTVVSAKSDAASVFSAREIGIAQWSFQNRKRAGFGSGTLVSSQWQFYPLTFKTNTLGVLAIKPRDPQAMLTQEKQYLLESFLNIVALGLGHFQQGTGTEFPARAGNR
jgi:two-component system sensor histidine kinase KdpD